MKEKIKLPRQPMPKPTVPFEDKREKLKTCHHGVCEEDFCSLCEAEWDNGPEDWTDLYGD